VGTVNDPDVASSRYVVACDKHEPQLMRLVEAAYPWSSRWLLRWWERLNILHLECNHGSRPQAIGGDRICLLMHGSEAGAALLSRPGSPVAVDPEWWQCLHGSVVWALGCHSLSWSDEYALGGRVAGFLGYERSIGFLVGNAAAEGLSARTIRRLCSAFFRHRGHPGQCVTQLREIYEREVTLAIAEGIPEGRLHAILLAKQREALRCLEHAA
jgi:hypothetical protein